LSVASTDTLCASKVKFVGGLYDTKAWIVSAFEIFAWEVTSAPSRNSFTVDRLIPEFDWNISSMNTEIIGIRLSKTSELGRGVRELNSGGLKSMNRAIVLKSSLHISAL